MAFSIQANVPQTMMIEVKDVHGIYRLLPLSSAPQFSMDYSVASPIPITEVSNVDFEIRRLLVVDAQGNPMSEYMGPFHSSSTFNHQAAPKPVTKPATKVLLEFEGEQHWLSVGDEFNLKYNLEVPQELLVTVDPNTMLNNFITQKKITIKDITGAAPKSDTMWITANPDGFQFQGDKWSELIDASLKQNWAGGANWDETASFKTKERVPHSEFNPVWIEKRQCYVISGFDGNNRYEVIIGTPIDNFSKFFSEVMNMDMEDAPKKLRDLIFNLNKSLKAKLGDGQEEFLKHPGLRQLVPCPAMKEKDPNVIDCQYYHPSNPGTDNLQSMIMHLNDSHRWTREAIAEWIDTLDEQPVFYPKPQPERVANSAKVVALQSPVSKALEH